MAQLNSIHLVLLLILCVLGCYSPTNEINKLLAIGWAEHGGVHISGVVESKIGKLDIVDYEKWISEGRSIPNCESMLIEILEDKDPRLHPILAIQGLGFIGTSECVPILASLLEDNSTIMFATMALSELALPDCKEPLFNEINFSGADTTVFHYAIAGLGKINDPEIPGLLSKRLEDLERERNQILQLLDHMSQPKNDSILEEELIKE